MWKSDIRELSLDYRGYRVKCQTVTATNPLCTHFIYCIYCIAPCSLPISSASNVSVSIKLNDDAHTTHPLSCLIHIVRLFMHVYRLFMEMGGDGVTNFRVPLFSFLLTPSKSVLQNKCSRFLLFFSWSIFVHFFHYIQKDCCSTHIQKEDFHHKFNFFKNVCIVVMSVWLRQLLLVKFVFFFTFSCPHLHATRLPVSFCFFSKRRLPGYLLRTLRPCQVSPVTHFQFYSTAF